MEVEFSPSQSEDKKERSIEEQKNEEEKKWEEEGKDEEVEKETYSVPTVDDSEVIKKSTEDPGTLIQDPSPDQMGPTTSLEAGPSNSLIMTPPTQVKVMLELKDLLRILVFIFLANSNLLFVS